MVGTLERLRPEGVSYEGHHGCGAQMLCIDYLRTARPVTRLVWLSAWQHFVLQDWLEFGARAFQLEVQSCSKHAICRFYCSVLDTRHNASQSA